MGVWQVWQFISLSIYAIINVNDYPKANCSKIIFSPDLENVNVNEEKLLKTR